MLFLEALILILVAVCTGILAAMMGVGGGFLMVPVLTLIFGFLTQRAVGTSLVTIIFTALSSSFAYARQKRIDYKLGLMLTTTTIPGAIVGAYVTKFIESKPLASLFGVLMIITALWIVLVPRESMARLGVKGNGWNRKLIDSEGRIFEYNANVVPGVALGFLGGLASGFFGIGGGAIMVPVILFIGTPVHIAIATSMFIMIFTSLSGAITHMELGNIVIEYAILLTIGIVFGAQLGAAIAKRLKAKALRRIFGFFIILLGVRMLLVYFLK